MAYLALFLIFIGFLKTFYYGIYEFKEKQNKPGGIAVFIFAILRTYYSYSNNFYLLHYLTSQQI